MARCPFAIWRPISAQYLPGIRKVAHNRMNVHITAALGSPFGYFNNPRKASSEFFTYASGVIEQFIDSDDQGEGDYDGNDATHAVENEGLGNAPLTPQQVASNARLFRWLRETHGVPNRIATNSKIGASSHGLSWHRLGIDGNFPALPSIQAGRLQRGGGMHYSTSFGKICPGYDVVPQIPEIFALSQGAVLVSNPSGGGGSTTPTPTGTLPAPLTPEDDMPLTPADLDAIQKRVNAALVSDIIRGTEFKAAVRAQASAAVTALIPTIAAALGAKIIAALPPAAAGVGVSLAQVEAAVKSALGTLQLKSV